MLFLARYSSGLFLLVFTSIDAVFELFNRTCLKYVAFTTRVTYDLYFFLPSPILKMLELRPSFLLVNCILSRYS